MSAPSNIKSGNRRMTPEPWSQYERLPSSLRAALREAHVNFSARSVWKHLRQHTLPEVLLMLPRAEREEIARFDPDSSHVRAGATILRYDEAERVRGRRGPRVFR